MVEQIDHVLLPRDIDIVGKEGEVALVVLHRLVCTPVHLLVAFLSGHGKTIPPETAPAGGGQAAALNFSCTLMVLELV